MEYLIGKKGNQPFPLTEASISRQHAILRVDKATGKMTLRDNNSTNGTWLIGEDGQFKRIKGEVRVTPDTLVRVGAVCTFKVKEVLEPKDDPEKKYDISHLRAIYDNYNQNKMVIESKQSSITMWRTTSMTLGIVFATAISMIIPSDFAGNTMVGGFIKVAGSLMAVALAWVIVDVKSKNLIRQKDMNERYFRKKYCCPKCGFHFGPRVFDNILAEGKCPNSSCKCKFKGK